MIKKYQAQLTTVSPIGIVKPSDAGVRAASNQARGFQQLAQTSYNIAAKEQEQKGRDYIAQLQVRNPETNQVEYKPIPDSLSPIARRTAAQQIDGVYQTELAKDLRSAARNMRYDAQGKPRSAEDYNAQMTAYIDKTKSMNERYSNYIDNYTAPLVADHITDIRVKAYDAQMKMDYLNKQDTLDNEIIPHLRSLSSSNAGDQKIFDAFGDEFNARDLMYKNAMNYLDEFEVTHASRMEGGLARNLRAKINKAYFGGQVDMIAGKIGEAMQSKYMNPNIAFDEEQSYLNAIELSLRNPKFYGALPAPIKAELAAAGFDGDFFGNPDMQSVRKELAGDLATMQGVRSEMRTNLLKDQEDAITKYSIGMGVTVSANQGTELLNSYGIKDGFMLLQNLPVLMQKQADGGNHPFMQYAMTDSEFTDQMKDMFSPAVIQYATSTNQLRQLTDFYTNATTKVGKDGRPYKTFRGLDMEAVNRMETLIAYGDTLTTMKMEEFAQRSEAFSMMAKEQRDAVIGLALGQRTMAQFIKSATGIDQAEEQQMFMDIAPTLIHVHGKDMAKKILKKTADSFYTKSDYMFRPAGINDKSLYSPEARYGTAFPVFLEAAQEAVSLVNPALRLGDDLKLIYDRRGGSGYPVYIVVEKDTGMPLMHKNNVLRVGGHAVVASIRAESAEIRNDYFTSLEREVGVREKLEQSFQEQSAPEMSP